MRNRLAFFVFCMCIVASVVYTEPLTIVTLKAWDGLKDSGFFVSNEYEADEERAFRMDVMESELGAIDADLVILTGVNNLPDAAESLSTGMGYTGLYSINQAGFRIGVVGIPWNLREGSVMLAREQLGFEPLDTKRFSGLYVKNTVSVGKKLSPQVMSGKISVSGRDVYVFSVHWAGAAGNPEQELVELTESYLSGDKEGNEYVKDVRTAVERSEESLSLAYSTLGFVNSMAGESDVILAGSFNVPPDSREMSVLRRAGFKDAWEAGKGPGYTLDGTSNLNITRFYDKDAQNRQERLDYILYRGDGIRVREADIVFDQPTFGVHPSDRFGLYVEFNVLPASE